MLMYLKVSLLQFAHPYHIHTLMEIVAENNNSWKYGDQFIDEPTEDEIPEQC